MRVIASLRSLNLIVFAIRRLLINSSLFTKKRYKRASNKTSLYRAFLSRDRSYVKFHLVVDHRFSHEFLSLALFEWHAFLQ